MRWSRTNPNGRQLVIHLTWGQDHRKGLIPKSRRQEMKLWVGVKDPRGGKLEREGSEKRLTTVTLI